MPCGPNNTPYTHHLVTVINTTFVNNKAAWEAGALLIGQVHGTTVCVNRIISFKELHNSKTTLLNQYMVLQRL